jgi:hypothetical protein
MKSPLRRSLFALSFASIACSSHAVLGNLLNPGPPWDNVGMILTNNGQATGSGVPITSRWVLTAGHVVRSGSGTISNPLTTSFRLGSFASGTNFGIDQIVPHPTSYGTRRRGPNVVSNSFDVGQSSGFNRWRMMYRYDFDGNGVDTMGDGGPVAGGDALGFSGDSGCPVFANNEVIGLHVGRFTGSIQFGTVGAAVQLPFYSQFIQSTTGVPEPASMIAISMGLSALALKRRKKA